MPALQLGQECYTCLLKLIDLTVTLATAEPLLQAQARHAARAVLETEFSPGAIPAVIANRFHQVIKSLTGQADPFHAKKNQETALAGDIVALLQEKRSADPSWLLALAAAGNALDFFRSQADIAQDMLSQITFRDSHLETWWACLHDGAGLLLYLADNAGEQFFDLPLVQFLRTSGWQVYYVVKGGPIQNDLTREDLLASGLMAALEPVLDTGAETVGLELALVTPEFQDLFQRADLILAKGMGHFETLAHLADPRLFFLLQAKCLPVAAALAVPRGSFVLRQAGRID